MKDELEFFGTTQKSAFLNMANKLIANYNSVADTKMPLYNYESDIYSENYRMKDCTALNALIRKLNNIIFAKGDPLSVPVFLKRVASGVIKNWGKPDGDGEMELSETYIGKGHFRWDWIAHTLSDTELKAIRLYLKSNDMDYATTEFKYKNMTIKARLVKSGVKFPNSKNDGLHNKYDVSVTNSDTDNRTSFDYYDSTHNYNNAITEVKGEDLLQAFECFISDAIAGDESFEDFCDNMGYDKDSRSAEKIWKECIKSRAKAKNVIDQDLYDFINELQERLS